MANINVRKSNIDEDKNKLELLIKKRVDTKVARKQTENDVDKLNNMIKDTIETAVRNHYKDKHFRCHVTITEKNAIVALELDSYSNLNEHLLHNIIADPGECIKDITTTMDKLLSIRDNMEYTPKNKSFAVRDETDAKPIVNVTFNTRTKYF